MPIAFPLEKLTMCKVKTLQNKKNGPRNGIDGKGDLLVGLCAVATPSRTCIPNYFYAILLLSFYLSIFF